jgi:GTPase
MPELKRTELSVRQERAVLVGVILPRSTADPRDPLGELASLAKTAGAGSGSTRGPTSAAAR